jgi:N4-gp56 family major capsid protein
MPFEFNQYGSPGLTPRSNVYAARDMLRHAMPVMVLEKFAQTKPMPKNKTETVKFRRPVTFTAATTPLVEGVTPPPVAFRYEDVAATLKQYGQVGSITDKVEDLHEDSVMGDMTKQLGENVGRTREALMWGVVRAGTNVFYANGSVRTDVNTPITLTKQRAVTRALKRQKGVKITSIQDGSVNYKTTPVEAAYCAVAHTDLENDIRNLPGFTPVALYGSRKVLHETEIGCVEDVRYFLSPDLDAFTDAGGTYNGSGTAMVSAGGANADVYPIIFFARDAYATVPLKGQGAVEPSIIPVGQKTKDDPLGQRGYAGWKMWWTSVITNDAWLGRLEVAATEL